MTKNIYSVGQVNNYIKNMFAQDFMMSHIYIQGEVSNCKYHSSGHVYFTLKDETGVLQAVMFASYRLKGLGFQMKEGDKVIVSGSVRIYERDGKYQLYAEEILLDGAGFLYQKFEALKLELEEMGMFAKEYKRAIPQYAFTIGIVTAPTGAAIHDIEQIARRRNPYVRLVLYPAKVQGEGSAESVAEGIRALEKMKVDVMIVGRGGGSIEDLWAFNEKEVAFAIFNCSVPVISAVGHETDTTIADYVADMRAPTPSAAAEIAVFEFDALMERIANYRMQLGQAVSDKINQVRNEIHKYQLRTELMDPKNQILEKRQTAADLEDSLIRQIEKKVVEYRHRTEMLASELNGLSPLKKLSGGYAFLTDTEGRTLHDLTRAKAGDKIKARMKDGVILAEILNIDLLENEHHDN